MMKRIAIILSSILIVSVLATTTLLNAQGKIRTGTDSTVTFQLGESSAIQAKLQIRNNLFIFNDSTGILLGLNGSRLDSAKVVSDTLKFWVGATEYNCFAVGAAPGSAGGESNDLVNLTTTGGQIRFSKVGSNINVRGIQAGANVTVTQNDSAIVVASTGGGGAADSSYVKASIDSFQVLNNALIVFLDDVKIDSTLNLIGVFTYQGSQFDTTSLSSTTNPIWQHNGTNWVIVATPIDSTTAGDGLAESSNAISINLDFDGGLETTDDSVNVRLDGTTLVLSSSGLAYSAANSETANEAVLDHDDLQGFVSDEHVAHSGVDITAGAGLGGGGSIDASRTLVVNAADGLQVVTDSVRILLRSISGLEIKTGVGGVDSLGVDTSFVATQSDISGRQPLDADLTTLASPTAWRVFYSDGSNVITELALGTAGQVLKSNGVTSAPSFQADATGGGGSATADSMATDWAGPTDFDDMFPSSAAELLIDTLGVVNANSNFIILSRTVGDILLQDSTAIAGTLDVSGSIEAGSGNIALTNAIGNILSAAFVDEPNIAFLNQAEVIASNWDNTANPWTVNEGGSGAATLIGVLQGNGTGAFTAISNSSTVGQVLRVTASNTYNWGALDLADADAVTGTLPDGNIPDHTGEVTGGTSLTIDRTTAFNWTGAHTFVRAGLGIQVQNTTDAVSNQVGQFLGGNRATAADNDEAYLSLFNDDDLGAQTEFVRLSWTALDVTSTSKDSRPEFDYYTADTFRKLIFPSITADDEVVVLALAQTLLNKTLTAPTISATGFTNAQHAHAAANSGGLLTTLGTITTGVWNGTILTGAFGGTNNGFMDFTGPASTLKTFTLPNASSVILTDNAVVTVAQGGIGVGTLTDGGPLLGSGTGAVTALAQPTNGQLIIGSTGADPVLATPTGRHITVTVSAGGLKFASNDSLGQIMLPAALWDTTSTSNGTLDFLETGAIRKKYWEFGASTADTLILTSDIAFALPEDFDSFVDAYAYWEPEQTGADTLNLDMEGYADDEVFNSDLTLATTGAAQLVRASGPASGDIVKTTKDVSVTGTYSAEDYMQMLLVRPATDAGVIRFYLLVITYKKTP